MLILASASPRRRELLTQAGFSFQVESIPVAEDPRPGEDPIHLVKRLAREKAKLFLPQPRIATQRKIPCSFSARIPSLSAITKFSASPPTMRMPPACCACSPDAPIRSSPAFVSSRRSVPNQVAVAAETTSVTMLTLSEEEILAYIATGEPMDKAGAYAIQGHASRWIPRIVGCYFNVVGLPLALVNTMIESAHRKLTPHPVS